jgi:hypothetical protein
VLNRTASRGSFLAVVALLGAATSARAAATSVDLLADARHRFQLAGGSGYFGGVDSAVRHRAGETIVLHAYPQNGPRAFGAFAEQIPVYAYRGKRLRISGFLKTIDADRGSYWMRVTGTDGSIQGFDDMSRRALSGTNDWRPFAIVLDIPRTAQSLIAGLVLQGAGTVWADDVRMDVVGTNVPTTNRIIHPQRG